MAAERRPGPPTTRGGLRGHYEKLSEKKARGNAEAVRRARKRAQREGLVPMKPKPVTGGPTRAPRRERAEA
jgi:small subunit ribosomal protein S21